MVRIRDRRECSLRRATRAPVLFHFAMENRRLDMVERGQEWAAVLSEHPRASGRHLAIHDQHLIAINERGPAVRHWRDAGQAGTRPESRGGGASRVADAGGGGARRKSRINRRVPEIASELEAFASAVRG